jgi:hypothetical protein
MHATPKVFKLQQLNFLKNAISSTSYRRLFEHLKTSFRHRFRHFNSFFVTVKEKERLFRVLERLFWRNNMSFLYSTCCFWKTICSDYRTEYMTNHRYLIFLYTMFWFVCIKLKSRSLCNCYQLSYYFRFLLRMSTIAFSIVQKC